jgi:hypothetical protein
VVTELNDSGATLLAVPTGANVIRADEESPQVVTHTIFQSGYEMLHAFEIGVTEAGGDALPAPAGTDPAVAALRSAVRTGWIDPYRI